MLPHVGLGRCRAQRRAHGAASWRCCCSAGACLRHHQRRSRPSPPPHLLPSRRAPRPPPPPGLLVLAPGAGRVGHGPPRPTASGSCSESPRAAGATSPQTERARRGPIRTAAVRQQQRGPEAGPTRAPRPTSSLAWRAVLLPLTTCLLPVLQRPWTMMMMAARRAWAPTAAAAGLTLPYRHHSCCRPWQQTAGRGASSQWTACARHAAPGCRQRRHPLRRPVAL